MVHISIYKDAQGAFIINSSVIATLVSGGWEIHNSGIKTTTKLLFQLKAKCAIYAQTCDFYSNATQHSKYPSYNTNYYRGFSSGNLVAQSAFEGRHSCMPDTHFNTCTTPGSRETFVDKMPYMHMHICTEWDLNPRPSDIKSTNHYTTVLQKDAGFKLH